VAGRDITEGRATRSIAVDVGVVSDTSIWQNTDVAYDVAIGGMPFIYAISDQRPYIRQTAPYRKEQFDNQTEPGEQSLTGWWIRSQSSFHDGTGVEFYDPALIPGEGTFRFKDSRGVNVWEQGQVTLLNNTSSTHETTGQIKANGRPFQIARDIQWSGTNGILLKDEFDVDKIAVDGTLTHFVDYNSGTDYPVYAICDDGVNAYWVTNVLNAGTPRLRVFSKPLTGTSSTTATLMISDNSITSSEAVMEYVKDRIIMAINNKIYEFAPSATTLPTPVYTHADTDIVFTDITASGTAIYVSAFSGIQSTIFKFTLNTSTGAMPSLTSAITAAEMPAGEKIFAMRYYLGYMLLGTNKGIRVATVDDNGSILYGPLMVETSQPCYDFAFRDRFAWCATGVAGEGGVIRIDLGNDLGGLRFAYANDLWLDNGNTAHKTTTLAFNGETDRLTFVTTATSTANGSINIESASTKMTDGYIQTGYIRYNTLEPKNFKRLLGRGEFEFGSMTLETVTADGTEFDLISYSATVPPVEITTNSPTGSQEYLGYKFILYRDGTDNTKGPTFKGYQAKATIATPRQRALRFPVYCFDVETDKYNVMVGYEGRAFDRLAELENIEQNGDVVTWQDLTTGESRQIVIEQINFVRATPPDRGFSGYGGIIEITIRTV
jgi:hypothetical protein